VPVIRLRGNGSAHGRRFLDNGSFFLFSLFSFLISHWTSIDATAHQRRRRFADRTTTPLDASALSDAVRNCPGDNFARRRCPKPTRTVACPLKASVGEKTADRPDYRRSMCDRQRNRDSGVLRRCEAEDGRPGVDEETLLPTASSTNSRSTAVWGLTWNVGPSLMSGFSTFCACAKRNEPEITD